MAFSFMQSLIILFTLKCKICPNTIYSEAKSPWQFYKAVYFELVFYKFLLWNLESVSLNMFQIHNYYIQKGMRNTKFRRKKIFLHKIEHKLKILSAWMFTVDEHLHWPMLPWKQSLVYKTITFNDVLVILWNFLLNFIEIWDDHKLLTAWFLQIDSLNT